MANGFNISNMNVFGWVGLAVLASMIYVFIAPKIVQPGPGDPVAPPAATTPGGAQAPPGGFGMGAQPFAGVAYTFPERLEGIMPYGFRMIMSS
jgi:hypothetical protein